jgi:hypothetical protein
MTTYLNNPYLKRVEKYLKDQPWFKDKIFDSTGTFPFPQKYMRDKYCQLDKLIAQAANIRTGVDLEFPDVSKSTLASLTRLAFWKTAKIDLTYEQRQDLEAGDPMIKTSLDGQIDSVNFNFNKDRRTWFVSGPTSGTDVNYSSEWIPWYALKAVTSTGDLGISDPADMNGKAGGTAGTLLDLTAAVLWSSTTNQSVDFVEALLGKIEEGFEAFEDTRNGRRMVALNQDGSVADNAYQYHFHPVIINRMKKVHPYDGEKVDFSKTIYDQIAAGGEVLADPDLTYSTAEDGECYFRVVANPKRNFGKGIINKPTWTKWVETNPGSLTSGAQKGFKVRYVPFTMPYFDGTNYFKAEVYGKFTFKNDAA